MTNIIIKNGFESINITKAIAIFVCSHLMDPDTIEIGISDFTVDGKTYHVTSDNTMLDCDGKTVEYESKWWATEDCDFDQCYESVADFSSRVTKMACSGKTNFTHDFTDRYEYYDAPESAVVEEKEEEPMTININEEMNRIREEVFWKPSEEPTQEELAVMDAELHADDIREAEKESHQEFLDEVAADEAAAAEQGITYDEYVDNKEAGVYDMLAQLDAESENASENEKEEEPMEEKVVIPMKELPEELKLETLVKTNIGEDRKYLVFNKENRPRLKINAFTIERTGTEARRRAMRAGAKFLPKLGKTVSALCKIDTLYTGYAHEQLLFEKLISAGLVKLHDANRAACMVENGTRDIITVSFDGIGRKKHMVRAIVKYIVRHGLWLVETPYAAGGFAIIFKNKNGKYQSLSGWVTDMNKPGVMDAWLKAGIARHFVYFIDSPSGYRQGSMPMIYVPYEAEIEHYIEADQTYCGFMDYMEEILNVATGYMYNVEKIANNGETMRIDKGIKLVGRQSLGVTPSTLLGHVRNLCVFIGKFGFSNGNGYVALQKIQELFEKKFGYPLPELEAYKFGGQHRINSFIKGHNQIVDREMILMLISYLVKTGVIKGTIVLKHTFEDSLKFTKIMNDPKYEGYLVVFGDMLEVDYFGDLDDVKCSTDFSRPLELRLMDISHDPKGFIPLSKQGIVQMQLTGNHFVDMYKTVGPASIERAFNHVEFDDVDDHVEEQLVTQTDAGSDAYNVSIIQNLCPQAINFDEQIKRIAVSSVVDTINNRFNRCNLTVAGQYLKIVPDFGGFFGEGLLAADEFYAPAWNFKREEGDDTGFDAVIIRYPLVDFGAFIKGRAVSREELISRIHRLPLEAHYIKAMLAIMKSITNSMVMIASTVEGVTDKLSGGDFDGDGVCLQADLAVKKVYVHLNSYSNNFGGSQPGNVYVAFNYDLGPTSFLYAWALDDENEDRVPNPAIGVVAGYNVTVSSMLALLLTGELTPEQIFHFFKDQWSEDDKGNPIIIPAEPGELEYHRLFTVDGSDSLGVDVTFEGRETTYVHEFEKALWLSDWSFVSCVRMLWDLNAVLSKSMNDVIDAAKNGAQVEVPFLDQIRSMVRSSSVATKDYATIKMSRSELKIEKFTDICKSPASEEEQKTVTILTNDPIGLMKHRIFELALIHLRRVLREEIEQDMEEMSGGTMLDNSLRMLAAFYRDLMKAEGNDKALAKKMVISMAYTLIKKAGITDPERILGVVLRASSYTTEEDGARKFNSFYIHFAEVVYHYVQKFCKDARYEQRIFKHGSGKVSLGQLVTLKDGRSNDGFYVRGKVNGSFNLEIDEKNRPIISRNVIDMVPKHQGNDKIAVMKLWKQYLGFGKNRQCLDPNFRVDDRIAYIEQIRAYKGFACRARLVDPSAVDEYGFYKTVKFKPGMSLKGYVVELRSNHGTLGFMEIPGGTSTYLEQILDKTYTINNVMKMGKGLETICVVAEEVAA